jgi:hypothetical protein
METHTYTPQTRTAHVRIIITLLMIVASSFVHAATVTVTPASNGSALCADSWTTLGDIVIGEGAIAGNKTAINKNQTNVTLILTAPTGYIFNPGSGSLAMAGSDISALALSVDSTTITVTFSTYNTGNAGDEITIQGIEAKALTPAPVAASGDILRLSTDPGTAGIDGIVDDVTSFGSLTQSDSMLYASSTVTQNTFPVEIGALRQQVIGIEVVTAGSCIGATLTQFDLDVTGSSDPGADITNAQVWYTGTSSIFDTVSLFGSQALPTTAYIINGSQALAEGTNYFWVTYDIHAAATSGNVVDGKCTNVIVDGTIGTPTVTTPVGSRTIDVSTITSNGTGGGDWNNGSSWVGGVAPTSTDHAIMAMPTCPLMPMTLRFMET